MLKFGARNNFVHKHVPFGHHFTATKNDELTFLEKHYGYPKKPFSTDQHIMFINAVEEYKKVIRIKYAPFASHYLD